MGDIYSGSSLMFHVEQSKDYKLIGYLITHKDIQENILSFPYEENKLIRDDIIYFVMYYQEFPVGICVLITKENFHFVDIGFIKIARGRIAKSLGEIVKQKIFELFPNDKIHVVISKKNKSSYVYAKWLGMNKFSEDLNNYYLEVSKDGRSN